MRYDTIQLKYNKIQYSIIQSVQYNTLLNWSAIFRQPFLSVDEIEGWTLTGWSVSRNGGKGIQHNDKKISDSIYTYTA